MSRVTDTIAHCWLIADHSLSSLPWLCAGELLWNQSDSSEVISVVVYGIGS